MNSKHLFIILFILMLSDAVKAANEAQAEESKKGFLGRWFCCSQLSEEKSLEKALSDNPLDLHSCLNRLETSIHSGHFEQESPVSAIVNQIDLNFSRKESHDIRHCLNDIEFAFDCLKTNSQDIEAISGLQHSFADLKSMFGKAFKMPDGSIKEEKKAPENIFNLTKSSLTCCSLSAKRFGVELSCLPSENLKDFVLTQEIHSSIIKRILYNLMKNAIIYSAESKNPKVNLAIETYQKGDQWGVKFSVTDTGIGMSPQFMSRSLFKEGSREKTTKQKGSGVGLSSCKELAESLGGEIGAASEGLGKGSTFWFTAPVVCIENISASAIVKQRADKQHMQVLIVDDDPIGRKMLQRQCKILGLENVKSVGTAKEALNFTTQTPCSLIFMDTNLNGKKNERDGKDEKDEINEIDGIELTKRILARTPPQRTRPRTISISSNPQALADIGMDGSLPKPFDFKRLQMLLEKHFEFSTINH